MSIWPINRESAAYLVSVDIVGFTSGDHHPLKYLEARTELYDAAYGTELVERSQKRRNAYIQSLGDELRLAFSATWCAADEIMDCLDSIFDRLALRTTLIRAVVVTGAVTPMYWHGCLVLKGAVTAKVQRWLDKKDILKPGCIVVDEVFYLSLSSGRSHKWRVVPVDEEVLVLSEGI